jgi:hypothetical protein
VQQAPIVGGATQGGDGGREKHVSNPFYGRQRRVGSGGCGRLPGCWSRCDRKAMASPLPFLSETRGHPPWGAVISFTHLLRQLVARLKYSHPGVPQGCRHEAEFGGSLESIAGWFF